jgi:H+/gluconate symporter-like permease
MTCNTGGSQKKSSKQQSKKQQQQSKKQQQQSKKQQQKSKRHSGGSVLEAAIVPFSLLAVQQWFGTRNVKSSNKTRKNIKTRKTRK